jgi:hypothetical protein
MIPNDPKCPIVQQLVMAHRFPPIVQSEPSIVNRHVHPLTNPLVPAEKGGASPAPAPLSHPPALSIPPASSCLSPLPPKGGGSPVSLARPFVDLSLPARQVTQLFSPHCDGASGSHASHQHLDRVRHVKEHVSADRVQMGAQWCRKVGRATRCKDLAMAAALLWLLMASDDGITHRRASRCQNLPHFGSGLRQMRRRRC